MNRISLDILRGPHPASFAAGHPVQAVRVFADLSLATANGWTSFQAVVVDTGAAVSLLPRRYWAQSTFLSRGRAKVGGVSRRLECLIDATLAEVECLIADGTVTLGPFRAHAYMADSDDVPALLGFAGLLDRLVLHVDVAADEAYIESN